MRWIEKRRKADDKFHVGGLLFVAGWLFIEKDTESPNRPEGLKKFVQGNWDKLGPWVETPLDFEAVSKSTQNKKLLISDNDEFTIDHNKNEHEFKEKLAFEVEAFQFKHFNGSEYPQILEKATELLGN